LVLHEWKSRQAEACPTKNYNRGDDLSGQKKFGIFSAMLIALLSCVNLAAQSAGEIVKVDPGLSALIPADARVEKVADGFGFVEGPVWVHN